MLLACSGNTEAATAQESMEAMRALLAAGAVPDTWAPNGSSVEFWFCPAENKLVSAING